MCRVNNFLGCVALETFGLFIGWFNMILLIIIAFISILGVVVCIVEKNGIRIVICVVFLLVSFLTACVCRKLIHGVENRDHTKVQGFRVLCIFNVIILALNAMISVLRMGQPPYQHQHKFTAPSLLSTIISLSVQIYFLICIDSLYKKLKDEKFPTSLPPSTMQPPTPYAISYQPPAHNPYVQAPIYPPTVHKY